MALSGTWTYWTNTEALDTIIEAYERIGMDGSQLSGNQIDSANRSLMALFSEFANKPVNLWTVSSLQTQALTAGLQSFNLQIYDLFILQAATRTTSGGVNEDLIISPISRAEYMALPNKAQQSTRPTQYYLQRSITPTVYVWPTADSANVSIIYYAARMQQDVGAFTNTLDAPQRWADAIIAGLAARLAIKFAPDRYDKLQLLADRAYAAAATEDTENVPLRLVPDMQGRRIP